MKPSELLSDASKWTQGAWARNSEMKAIAYDNPAASCWCLAGAMAKCDLPYEQRKKVHDKIDGTVSWNDAPERTFEEVRALLIECGL